MYTSSCNTCTRREGLIIHGIDIITITITIPICRDPLLRPIATNKNKNDRKIAIVTPYSSSPFKGIEEHNV